MRTPAVVKISVAPVVAPGVVYLVWLPGCGDHFGRIRSGGDVGPSVGALGQCAATAATARHACGNSFRHSTIDTHRYGIV